MGVASVNVSLPKEVSFNGRTVSTGIFKEPVEGRVAVRTLGLEGDGQADLTVHGGVAKAVYGYALDHYDFWRGETGRDDLVPGQFGENLTIDGLLDEDAHIGDVFRIGTALLQVTQPRLPCFKLGIRMGDPGFPKQFMKAGRMGYYFRVLEEGVVESGDSVEVVDRDVEKVSIPEVVDLWFYDKTNYDRIEAALRADGLERWWIEGFTERLANRRG